MKSAVKFHRTFMISRLESDYKNRTFYMRFFISYASLLDEPDRTLPPDVENLSEYKFVWWKGCYAQAILALHVNRQILPTYVLQRNGGVYAD